MKIININPYLDELKYKNEKILNKYTIFEDFKYIEERLNKYFFKRKIELYDDKYLIKSESGTTYKLVYSEQDGNWGLYFKVMCPYNLLIHYTEIELNVIKQVSEDYIIDILKIYIEKL